MQNYFIFKITVVTKSEIDREWVFFYNTSYTHRKEEHIMKEQEKNPGFALEENLKKSPDGADGAVPAFAKGVLHR